MDLGRLRPLKNGSLREQVKDTIRDAILQGKLLPGDPLRELELARRLRVSQATVREGLLQLENSGLLVRVPNKSTMVASLSRQDLKERVSIRILLEGTATTQAAARMSGNEIQELQRRAEGIAAAIAKNDYFEVSEADLDFHSYLWAQSGNATLARMLENLTAPLFLFIGMVRRQSEAELKKVIKSHGAIVSAIRKGDPAQIELTMRQHVEDSYEEFLTNEDWPDFRALLRSRHFRHT